jgi:L-rhamnose mutarotase
MRLRVITKTIKYASINDEKKTMKYFAKALGLKNDPALIAEYEAHHENVWPEVLAAIAHVGILDMKIFRLDNNMFMYMVTNDDFNQEFADQYLAADPVSQKWEALMDTFQERLPNAPANQKWVAMSCCFDLTDALAKN